MPSTSAVCFRVRTCGALAIALMLMAPGAPAAGLTHFPDPMFHDGMEGPTAGPFNDADAARFLAQATFGPTDADIAHLRALTVANNGAGYEAWLNEQFNAAPTLMQDYYAWVTSPPLSENPGDSTIREAWLRGALGGTDPQNNLIQHNDQLRQRIAFALSEIFVISEQNTMLDQNPDGQAYFYDFLVNNASGNYRTLLEQVTLSPAMGVYLNMIGNPRANIALNQHPDENYAREINQLFSIGLFMLNDDGTLVLSAGKPVATYSQSLVTAFAHVFTGWNFASWNGGEFWPYYPHAGDFTTQMAAFPAFHDDGTHADDFLNKQLFSYSSAASGGLLVGGSAAINTPAHDLGFALDNIFNHPNVPPFISKQLIQRLVTSNPSPAYVQRVTGIFKNDGANVRGNLWAVVKAILLDPEARYGQFWAPTTFGKLREPDLRVTHFWRAMHAVHICGGNFPGAGKNYYLNPYRYSGYSTGYGLGDTIYGSGVGQAVLNANTVFNFFRPDFVPSGEMASLGLLGPEFQINTDTLISNSANSTFSKARNYDSADSCTGYAGGPGEVATDRTADAAFLTANGPAALIDKYNTRFMSGQMSPFMRQTLLTWLTSLGGTSKQRVNSLLTMLLTSPEYMIQK